MLSGRHLPPTLSFSTRKPLPLQREFTLSPEDTKTWNKQALIINALFSFLFCRDQKLPGRFLSQPGRRGDPVQPRMLSGWGEREPEPLARVGPRPFPEAASTLLRDRVEGGRVPDPREGCRAQSGRLVGTSGREQLGLEDCLEAKRCHGHWPEVGASKQDEQPPAPHRSSANKE